MNDAFDGPTAPTRSPPAGWEAEQRRLELQRDDSRARAAQARWAVVGAVLLAVSLAWWFRWDVIAIPGGPTRNGTAYAVDRLTGSIYWLDGDSRDPVPPPTK